VVEWRIGEWIEYGLLPKLNDSKLRLNVEGLQVVLTNGHERRMLEAQIVSKLEHLAPSASERPQSRSGPSGAAELHIGFGSLDINEARDPT